MDETLESAIEQLKQGEQQGFQILYDKTHNYVCMQVRTLLKNETDVNDLVQEVYINAYRSISSLQDNKKIYAWLGGIAFRQATKIYRKQKDVLLSEESTVFDTLEEFDADVQPEQSSDKKATAQIIKEMLDELPELQKAALLAYYYDEMSIHDIAEAFECSEGTIKSRLNYARKTLKESVKQREKKDGIKLYSLSIPVLILAFYAMLSDSTMEVQAAETTYQKCVEKLSNEFAQPMSASGTDVAGNGLESAQTHADVVGNEFENSQSVSGLTGNSQTGLQSVENGLGNAQSAGAAVSKGAAVGKTICIAGKVIAVKVLTAIIIVAAVAAIAVGVGVAAGKEHHGQTETEEVLSDTEQETEAVESEAPVVEKQTEEKKPVVEEPEAEVPVVEPTPEAETTVENPTPEPVEETPVVESTPEPAAETPVVEPTPEPAAETPAVDPTPVTENQPAEQADDVFSLEAPEIDVQ